MDPFKIHFDFTFFVLLAAAWGATGTLVRSVATALLAFGFIEIVYTTVMHSIFKRPPELASDWSLLRAGIKLAQRQVLWMAPLVLGAIVLIAAGAAGATWALLEAAPAGSWLAASVAVALVPPCFYHCAIFYAEYPSRTVYSPLLHLILNVRASSRVKRLYSRDATHYERHNAYRDVSLERGPNIIIVCIESYGGVVYGDARLGAGIPALLDRHEPELVRRGYRVASTLSDAPLFAGGSWLSYASFTYGAAIDNVALYEGLFSRPNGFGVYESLFHVLRRSGYDNVLLCPLGGVDSHSVDWRAVDRCFQCQRRITFDELEYVGPLVNYLGSIRRYSALDQFSLNFGYEAARAKSDRFSLFFCTLNSHYPWHSSAEATDDWRSLNSPGSAHPREPERPLAERYSAAIRYQLDYVLRFATARADDSPLIVVFGDHQPPIITPEAMGKQTPVHVISRDRALVEVFLAHGFAGTLNLTNAHPRSIRHEGFLSLFMKALQCAYGSKRDLELPYREFGAPLFDDTVGRLPAR
jgi:hypothetical protein